LTDSSISVHDGDRDLTCSIDATSPSTGDLKVGRHVKISCANGVLVAIASVVLPTGEKPKGQTGAGAISALSPTSITFHNAERDVTCAVAASSPGLGDYRVGDKVQFGCLNGTLAAIAKAAGGVDTGAHKTTRARSRCTRTAAT
jgi:hypothetical protein